MFRHFLLAAALTFAVASPAMAEPKNYTFDKAHTQILFFVNHMGFSNSNGKFLDFDGGITYDAANPAASSANITIKTDSLNMDMAKWDEHLKSADFFNTAKFPTMTFKSTKIEAVDATHAKMTGDLTLLGVTKPVTLDVTLNKCGPNLMNQKPQCGFDLAGTIKRSEWGMSGSIPAVGDDVKLMITVEAPEVVAAK